MAEASVRRARVAVLNDSSPTLLFMQPGGSLLHGALSGPRAPFSQASGGPKIARQVTFPVAANGGQYRTQRGREDDEY